jgi:hypothetical protein
MVLVGVRAPSVGISSSVNVSITRRNAQAAPLSLQQEHIWRSPNRLTHNIPPMVARLDEPLDVPRLRGAFNALLDRHDILRTRFVSSGRYDVEQIVEPTVPFDLKLLDLSTVAPDDRSEKVLAIIRDRGRAPFDLAVAPLLRVGVIRLSERDTVVWAILHHLVSDLWSMRLFLREANQLYATGGRAADLQPLELQYNDYALWQREWLRADVLEKKLQCWGDRLNRSRPLALPMSRRTAGTAGAADGGGVVSNTLPRWLSDAVRALARAQRATPFMTLLTAFQILLWLYTDADDIVVDTLIANRDRPEIEPLIGMFAGTVPIATPMGGNPAGCEVIRRTRDECLDVFAHQHLTFRKAIEILTQRDGSQRVARPQVLFSMQKSPVVVGDAATLTIADEQQPGLSLYDGEIVDRPLWDQTWQIWDTDNQFTVIARYATSLFERNVIEHMYEDYRNVITALVATPTETLQGFRRSVDLALQPVR